MTRFSPQLAPVVRIALQRKFYSICARTVVDKLLKKMASRVLARVLPHSRM